MKQDHNLGDVSVSFDGEFRVENPSTVDRIWDVDIMLENTDKTDIGEEEIDIKEIGTADDDNSWSKKFKLAGDAKNLLMVKEYISTLPREEADNILNPTDIDNDLDKLQEKGVEQTEEEDEDEEEDIEEEDIEEESEDEEEWTDGGVEAAEYNLESFAVPKDAEKTIRSIPSISQKPFKHQTQVQMRYGFIGMVMKCSSRQMPYLLRRTLSSSTI